MKSKRAKTRRSPISQVIKPANEKCWFCEINADASAQVVISLTKSDDEFRYFHNSEDDAQEKQLVTGVAVPRCIECRAAHEKSDNFGSSLVLYGLIGICLLGVYLGIFSDRKILWENRIAIGLGIGVAVVIIAVGARRNFFTLPEYIKPLSEAEKHPQVHQLRSKGWEIKS